MRHTHRSPIPVLVILLVWAATSYVYPVVPVLIGPLQVLIAMLPAILMGILGIIISLFKPSAVKKGIVLLWRQKVPVIIIAAAVTGLVYAKKTFFPSRDTVGTYEKTSDTWPLFRATLGRTGALRGARGPTRGGVVWAFRKEIKTFYSSPTVVGNRVYVCSADKGVFRDKGAVYCLDADTGGVVWKTAPKGFRATFSSPSVAGKYLVCGEGLHFTRDARIICLDVERNGALLWEYRTGSHVESSPCIYKDRVYIGAGDDGYYCFKLEPSPEGKPVMVWHVEGDAYPDAETSPAVWNGKVYVGLGMGGKAVCCFDADTGKEIWKTDAPYPVFTPPTVYKGMVIVGMGNGNFIETAEVVRDKELKKMRDAGASEEELKKAAARLGPAGEVWALDAETGKKIFTFKVDRTVLGAVAAAEERLYFGTRGGHVYALSLAGREEARWNAHAPVIASPAVADGRLYVVTEAGILYAIDLKTFTPVWEVTLGTVGPFLSSPAVARGHVYVGSQEDGLLCLGEPGEREKPLWAAAGGGPGMPGMIDGSPLPARASFGWRIPLPGASAASPAVTAPAACLEKTLYLPVARGEKKGIVCITIPGRGRRAKAVEKWRFPANPGVFLSPAADGERVVAVTGRTGDAGRHMFCIAAKEGKELWRKPVASDASGFFLLTREAVFGETEKGRLSRIGFDGTTAWSSPAGVLIGSPAALDAVIVAVSTRGIAVLDILTGAVLWERDAPVCSTGPVVKGKFIYVGGKTGVSARALTDGAEIWSAEAGGCRSRLVLHAGSLYYVNDKKELVEVNAETGAVEKKIAGAVLPFAPAASRDVILFFGRGEITAYNRAGGKRHRWLNISWMGTPTAPMAGSGGRIYFATDKGFVGTRTRRR